MIRNMSIKGKAIGILVVVVITSLVITNSLSVKALKVEKARSNEIFQELVDYKTKAATELATYKAKSITLAKLEKKERLKVQVYIKKSFRTIPKSTAKLIAESTTMLARKYDIPSSVIVGMMKVESNFNPSAVSSKHARGLMQVRWSIWKKVLGERLDMQEEFDLHNIKEGMEAGVIILKHYLKKNKGDVSRALYDYVGKNRSYVT